MRLSDLESRKMSNLSVFNFDTREVRTLIDAATGEPWFVAADVCAALELDDTSKAVSRLDDDEKGTNTVPTPGGAQEMITINESGLYSLTLTSRKPEAKRFKKWITSEVLPSIRKNGSYSMQQATSFNVPTTFAGALRLALEQAELIEQQTALIAQQAPAVAYVEKFVKADGLIGVREAAKSLGLNQNAFVNMLLGAGLMFRENGHLQAYAGDIDAGRFVVQAGTDSTGKARASTKFTARGLRWVASKLRLDQLFQD